MIRTRVIPLTILVILAGCVAQQPAPTPPLPSAPRAHDRVPAAAEKPVHQDNLELDQKIERLQNQIENLRARTAPNSDQ